MNMMMLRRGVRTITAVRGSFRPLIYSSFSSSSSSPSSTSNVDVVAAGAAADVAGEDLLLDDDDDDDDTPTSPAAAATAKPVMIPSLLQPRVVVYDGVCHLCHRGVKWVIEVDKHRKIKFCCLQSKAAEPYMRVCGIDREDVLRRFLFIEGPGLYHQGSTVTLVTGRGAVQNCSTTGCTESFVVLAITLLCIKHLHDCPNSSKGCRL